MNNPDTASDANPTSPLGLDVDVNAAVTTFALTHPQMGQAKVAAALRERGIKISASGVRYLWSQRGLETTFKRLKAIEHSVRNGSASLTESQRDIVRRGERGREFARTSQAGARADASIARRELIVAAAAQLFVERGYAGTSMRDIAAHVGLLAGSVYHYYPAKENLFVAVQREGFRQIIARVERAIHAECDPWKRLELACAEHVHSVVAGDAISRVTAIGLFAIHEEVLHRRLKRDHDRYDNIFQKLIDALPMRREVDRSLLRLALFGAMNWTLIWFRPGRMSPAEVATCVVGMFRNGTVSPVHASLAMKRGRSPRARR